MPTASDRVWYLKRINLFHCLPAEALNRVQHTAGRASYQRGQIIFGPDSPGDTIYLLEAGRVKIARFDDGGREVTLAILEEGEFFGEEALATGRRGNSYAEAIEESRAWLLARAEFESILSTHPDVALTVARQMSDRLLGARAQIESLAFRDVPQRLAGVLVELGEKHGHRDPSGRLRIQLRLTHQELASLVASTRETVTTLLGRFRREGLLDTDGRWLVLPNPEGLRAVARGR